MSNIFKKVFVINLKIGDKTCNFLSLYRSPSQSQDRFETFTKNFELNLQNLVQRNSFLNCGNHTTGFVQTQLALKEMELKI